MVARCFVSSTPSINSGMVQTVEKEGILKLFGAVTEKGAWGKARELRHVHRLLFFVTSTSQQLSLRSFHVVPT